MFKKLIGAFLVLTLALGLSLAGCAPAAGEGQNGAPATGGEQAAAPDTLDEENDDAPPGAEAQDSGPQDVAPSRVLIAYFSWADNAVVDLPASDDSAAIDALASASLFPPGNTGLLAYWIQENIGGSVFSIQVTDPFPSDFGAGANRVNQELAANARPELAGFVDNIADYDVIFIGFPVWADAPPMAVFSFIEQHDLSGLSIAFFSSFGGGSIGNSVRMLTEALPDGSTIVESTFGASGATFGNAEENIAAWLATLVF
ncbi:MAG: hypothetical protein FWB97_11225 [Oscillospiraceae bacterium]|nr:hypothetical protein [Oscillospiraceae bacterium]